MQKLIIEAFRAWKAHNIPRGVLVEIYHVAEFFKGLCPEDQGHAVGDWETVCRAVRQAGEYECHGDHLSICDVYLGRPEGRSAWQRWRRGRR